MFSMNDFKRNLETNFKNTFRGTEVFVPANFLQYTFRPGSSTVLFRTEKSPEQSDKSTP